MLQEYYNRRAPEYDAKYQRDDPVRQSEQSEIATALRETFADRRVLEVACGTGYWTAVLAQVARQVVATDASREMLHIADGKRLPESKVQFRTADAYDLGSVPGNFDGGLANFWLSHVRKRDLERFLKEFHRRLEPGAVVFMADDVYVPGVGGELVEPEGDADTYKRRILADGSEHTIVKNYYDEQGLGAVFGTYASQFETHMGTCHWWVRYMVKATV